MTSICSFSMIWRKELHH